MVWGNAAGGLERAGFLGPFPRLFWGKIFIGLGLGVDLGWEAKGKYRDSGCARMTAVRVVG